MQRRMVMVCPVGRRMSALVRNDMTVKEGDDAVGGMGFISIPACKDQSMA
jgi:hypothetical protein